MIVVILALLHAIPLIYRLFVWPPPLDNIGNQPEEAAVLQEKS
jgi:hypothetical protein